MSRSYRLYLNDIRDYSREISEHIHGLSYEEFIADRRTLKAVAYSLQVIGEAAKHVPDAIRSPYPEIDWRRISGMRDVIAHGYFRLDLEIVWNVAQHEIPLLRAQIERILAELPNETPPGD